MVRSTSDEFPGTPRVLIAARAGDPLLMEGRARLIWAANTSDATAGLGARVWLACQGEAASYVDDAPVPLSEPNEAFCRFYGIDGQFEVIASPFPRWRRFGGKKFRESGSWEANVYIPRHVLPWVDVVQTRDFRLASRAVLRGIPTIYEDHNESYHTAIKHFPRSIVEHPAFRVAVATTQAIRERLIARGMPAEKAIVAWSGLNRHSLKPVSAGERARIREQFLGVGHKFLVTYAGGLHACRGVEGILRLATERRDTTFLVLGGRQAHARSLRREVMRRGLRNLHVLGYLPQNEVPGFLQASDAVLMPYNDAQEARITSPLKFFEYLASGTPIIAARLPELRGFLERSELGVEWCGIADYDCFRASLDRTLSKTDERQTTEAINRQAAAHYTWEQRQRKIFWKAGIHLGTPAAAASLGPAQTTPGRDRQSQTAMPA